ncbi:MAG TPA: toll/interleukin-1 receptor domain-containing protein, partial [Aggregatilineales bacterium]|nr:toll/interleukin-1 receptor domain-containing protein [Aggregatilineales bacterium]
MVGTTFLSYSRKQYYFAESIALHLQHRGVSVWFDIQQLEPGVNWQADIEAGLAGCSSVTLVASRSALASSYVAREWRHALDHGKPIFVVLCERVRLPIELRQRAIIADCRGDFEQGVQALVVQFQNPDRSCNPATWLPRLPGGVRRMTRALWLHDLRHFTRVALNFMLPVLMVSSGAWPRLLIDLALGKIIDVPTVFGAFVVGLAILTLVRYVSRPKQTFTALTFLRHDFNYEALVAEARTVGAWTQMLGLWFSLAASYVIFSTDLVGLTASLRRLVHTEFSVEGLLALLAAILLVPVFNRLIPWIMPHHPDPDIVRWATPGNVS